MHLSNQCVACFSYCRDCYLSESEDSSAHVPNHHNRLDREPQHNNNKQIYSATACWVLSVSQFNVTHFQMIFPLSRILHCHIQKVCNTANCTCSIAFKWLDWFKSIQILKTALQIPRDPWYLCRYYQRHLLERNTSLTIQSHRQSHVLWKHAAAIMILRFRLCNPNLGDSCTHILGSFCDQEQWNNDYLVLPWFPMLSN